MVVLSRKVVEVDNLGWLVGFVAGDGFVDDRHVEIYNSSPSTLIQTMRVLRILRVPKERIKVDVTTENKKALHRWANILDLPYENLRSRKTLSPWKANKEMVRIRVSSKELADTILHVNALLSKASKKSKANILFVKGLFDAEASVDSKGYIEFKQIVRKKGKDIVYAVYKILASLRIECTEPKTKQNNKKEDIYFYIKNIEKYQELIGFIDSYKKEKLKILIGCLKKNNRIEKSDILNFAKKPVRIFDIMKEFNCAYHSVRIPLNSLIKEGKISRQREGLNIVYFTARQTR